MICSLVGLRPYLIGKSSLFALCVLDRTLDRLRIVERLIDLHHHPGGYSAAVGLGRLLNFFVLFRLNPYFQGFLGRSFRHLPYPKMGYKHPAKAPAGQRSNAEPPTWPTAA